MTATAFANPQVLRRIGAPEPIQSIAALAAEFDRDPANFRKTLKLLEGEGVIARSKDGPYGLTDRGRQVLAGIDVAEGRAPAAAGDQDLIYLRPSDLRPDPDNPRRRFDPAEMEAMAQGVADKGVLLPLLVRAASPLPFDDDAYPGEAHVIIDGERRWRACRMIEAAGEWPEDRLIPCRIATPEDEADALESAVAANMQRSDLNHMEMGHAFEKLAQAGRENADIARVVGKTPEFIQQHRRLTRLPADAQAAVAAGSLPLHDALAVERSLRKPAPAAPEPQQDALFGAPEQPSAPDDPLVVGGVRYPNATRANEARRIAAGGGPANYGRPAARVTTEPALVALSGNARLALIELAHKIGDQRLALLDDAEWSGDPEQDFAAFGAEVGQYWSHASFSDLVSARLARAVHRPGGKPPMAALTPQAVEWFGAQPIALPVSDGRLTNAQVEMARREDVLRAKARYATPWLERSVAPMPTAETAVFTTEGLVTRADEAAEDHWGRDAEAVAADQQRLERIQTLFDRPGDGDADAARQLMRELTLAGPFMEDGDAGVRGVWDGVMSTIAYVDLDRQLPPEQARGVAMLIAWALAHTFRRGAA